jgi:hypothetical protein
MTGAPAPRIRACPATARRPLGKGRLRCFCYIFLALELDGTRAMRWLERGRRASPARLRNKENVVKRTILSLVLATSLIAPVMAKNFAVPAKNPALTVVLPDNWKTEEIDFGYSAKSPDGDVFFSVEYASGKKVDALLEANVKWMKENKIDFNVKPEKLTMNFNGASGDVMRYVTKDENGPTIVDFVLLNGGNNTLVMITLWADEDERKANAAAIDSIMNSIKPIN